MSRVRSRDTGPELALRAALRAAGLVGYRLHRKELPGRPDIAFGRWRVVIFVDGVFWHGHPDGPFKPDTASEFWRRKIAGNIARDRAADTALQAAGWTVLRFWDTDIETDPGGCVESVSAALTAAGRPNRDTDFAQTLEATERLFEEGH